MMTLPHRKPPARNGVGPSCVSLTGNHWPTLLDFLLARFPNVTGQTWLERIRRGDVFDATGVAIDPVRASQPPGPGQSLLYYFREVPNEVPIPFDEVLLYQDDHLLVVDKPAGLPTQPTLDESRASVFTTLKAFLEQRDGRPPYLGLHHRLDRDTSGVLLFTKDQKANLGVAALFASKTMRKTYQALAAPGTGCPDQWEVENHLGVVGRVGKASKFGAVRSGGDAAQTSFRVLERLPGAVLVEARPHTGRTHQIRVHLAEDGHPIYGDAFYGGAMQLKAPGGAVAVPRVLLHAAELEFPHPLTDAVLKIRCPLPADFELCVRPLRAPLGGKR